MELPAPMPSNYFNIRNPHPTWVVHPSFCPIGERFYMPPLSTPAYHYSPKRATIHTITNVPFAVIKNIVSSYDSSSLISDTVIAYRSLISAIKLDSVTVGLELLSISVVLTFPVWYCRECGWQWKTSVMLMWAWVFKQAVLCGVRTHLCQEVSLTTSRIHYLPPWNNNSKHGHI